MAPLSKFPSQQEAMGYAYIVPPNGTSRGDGHFVIINGTLIEIIMKKPFKDSELNELLYVIIVIVFYATALMTLIITQIRRQRREGTDVDYYDEYLQRNQEVKRACQTATKVVMSKADKAKAKQKADRGEGDGGSGGGGGGERGGQAEPGSTSASGGGSSTALLEPPVRARDLSPRSPQRASLFTYGRGNSSSGAGGSGYGGDDIYTYTPSVSPRELSPMLESIPDIGT